MANVDTVERKSAGSGSEPPTISVIIPVLNEELIVEKALSYVVAMSGSFEVIVVDNGSTDETFRLASKWTRTMSSPPGRGPAMNAGADKAKGRVLLFLHVDTTLPPDSFSAISLALEDPKVVGGCFSISYDGG